MQVMVLPRWRSFRALLGLVAMLSAAATCGGSASSGPNGDADVGPVARNAATAALLPTHVAALPTFDVDAFNRLLTQLHGTPVVVNIWAAWCGPCKAEAPLLHAASQTYGDRVQFLGVDIVDSLDGARAFIADHGLTYPSVFDPSGAIRDSLGMIGQPVTVFYAADGTLVSSWEGQLKQSALDDGINAALA
jgi:cytochrome c biogenesis protein CcmG, thiol:disulfide interchange protein DsbE